MCCPVEWGISGFGLSLAGILLISAAPRVYCSPFALGSCRGRDVAPAVAILLVVQGSGLILLAVVQMCLQIVLHAVGAFAFFGVGTILIFASASLAVLPCGSPPAGARNEAMWLKCLRCIPLVVWTGAPVAKAWDGYMAEWLLGMSITVLLACYQFDLATCQPQSATHSLEAPIPGGPLSTSSALAEHGAYGTDGNGAS